MLKFFKSFHYAANGFAKALKQERNLRFHICAAIYVYVFSLFYSFTTIHYAIITFAVCGVISLEIVNSAIERLADNPSPGRYHIAGVIKDMADAAVLVFSVGSAVIGVLLFWNVNIFYNIFSFFVSNLIFAAIFILSLIISGIFIFKTR